MNLRIAISALAIVTGAGCASGGKSGGYAERYTPQIRMAHGLAPVCTGTTVSNAPRTDRRNRALVDSPALAVRGAVLSRAPVSGCISSGFGPRALHGHRFHKGLDIYTPRPTPVGAAGAGRIVHAGPKGSFGLTVEIDHGRGVVTRYAHLSKIHRKARPGARVDAGQPVGLTGATGSATGVHLHYEISVDGRRLNPLAPNMPRLADASAPAG